MGAMDRMVRLLAPPTPTPHQSSFALLPPQFVANLHNRVLSSWLSFYCFICQTDKSLSNSHSSFPRANKQPNKQINMSHIFK